MSLTDSSSPLKHVDAMIFIEEWRGQFMYAAFHGYETVWPGTIQNITVYDGTITDTRYCSGGLVASILLVLFVQL